MIKCLIALVLLCFIVTPVQAQKLERVHVLLSTTIHESIAFSPDSQWLATVGYVKDQENEFALEIWDVSSGQLMRTIPLKTLTRKLRFSPDGSQIAVSYRKEQDSADIDVFDFKSGDRLFRISQAHDNDIWDISYSPDGNRLVSVSAPEAIPSKPFYPIKVWDTHSGKVLREIRESTKTYSMGTPHLGFDPSGKLYTLNRKSSDPYLADIKVWDVTTGMVRVALKQNTSIYSFKINPDGKSLIAEDWGKFYLVDLKTGSIVKTSTKSPMMIEEKDVYTENFTMHPDSKHLVLFGAIHDIKRLKQNPDGSYEPRMELHLWNLETRKLEQRILLDEGVCCSWGHLHISPDGQWLALSVSDLSGTREINNYFQIWRFRLP